MDVTRHTFHEQFETIVKDINESSFIAIDGEFTGLDATDGGHAMPFDTPEERYAKIKHECPEFLLIQFGLCTFKADEEKQMYVAKPYNFYIFPVPLNKHSPDKRFLCQSSSIDFLISQGFDFNKLFKEGIPFLTPEEENKVKTNLARKHEEESTKLETRLMSPNGRSINKKSYAAVPEEQKSFLNNICEQISTYLESDITEPLAIPPCNSFQRKLIHQIVEERFPLASLKAKNGENNMRYLEVTRTNTAEVERNLLLKGQLIEKMELNNQVGFSKVIRAITASKKLVVGHNMVLDIFHVINKFHGSLPENLEEFKSVTKTVFPRLLDTKLMASTRPIQELIQHSGLNDVRQTLESPPFRPAKIEPGEGFDRYSKGGGALHEAGYDAYITGHIFTTMLNYLGTLQQQPAEFTPPSSSIVEPFVNKLFLMRINDIPYMNIDGPDLKVNRSHVFHVTFPKEWKSADIYNLFQPYGSVSISWLSETSAYVALNKKENASSALKALSQHQGVFHVLSYAAHNLSKTFHWSASASPAVTSPRVAAKRKMKPSENEHILKKAMRRSLSDEVSPYPVIPEEDENLNTSVTETEEENMQTTTADDMNHATEAENYCEDTQSPKEKVETPDTCKSAKLFDESDTW